MFEGWLFLILFCLVKHPKDSGISRHYKSWEHHRCDWIIYTSALTLPAPIHHTKKKVMKSPPLQPSLTNLKRHFQEPFSLRQSLGTNKFSLSHSLSDSPTTGMHLHNHAHIHSLHFSLRDTKKPHAFAVYHMQAYTSLPFQSRKYIITNAFWVKFYFHLRYANTKAEYFH